MKNLLNLGKALNKAEQKEIFGGTNRLTKGGSGGGGGASIPGSGSCQTDADCGTSPVQVAIPLEDCPAASQALFGGCGYETHYVQMTCFNNGGTSGTCVA